MTLIKHSLIPLDRSYVVDAQDTGNVIGSIDTRDSEEIFIPGNDYRIAVEPFQLSHKATSDTRFGLGYEIPPIGRLRANDRD